MTQHPDIYDENCQTGIEQLLMGRSVTVTGEDSLRLDDGTELKIIPNLGGCSCSAGDYALTALNGIENVITRVELVDEDTDDYTERAYRIFVYAGDQQVNLISVEGDDGNGYYGTGYQIEVRKP